MNEPEWSAVPIGIDAKRWTTRGSRRTVLVVVHTVVSGQRLLDIVGLIESDPRVQVVYTRGPDIFHGGVEEFLRSIGALEIPWQQAVREQFDLAIAAAYGGLAQLHAPIMVLPHGAGYAKQTPQGDGNGPTTGRAVYGLGTEHLVRDGRVVPSSIVLSHFAQREVLARQCPPAADVALVAGDPCYDRLRASLELRDSCRDAIGIQPGQRLVVIASTWGPHSLLARSMRLISALIDELPRNRYRAAALFHPAVWFGHGIRQVRSWFTDQRAAGLIVAGPDVDWRSVLIAADYVVGDHGSVSTYAAAIGKPVLQASFPSEEIDETSAQAYVGSVAYRLSRSRRIEPQLRDAASTWQVRPEDVAERLTSCPGQAHRLLREEMYRLLALSVPGRHRAVEPVELPTFGGDRRYA
ncbi:hypothetical protein [Amycolatopsis aidingensis]|uniref:hypothetical protein n=1 Tax=Amycolatopsis aidingensis TaxID=2842453 RepID=UPI001C0C0709|nr:hypothetical protein [Amycolatopsis aidingensis]